MAKKKKKDKKDKKEKKLKKGKKAKAEKVKAPKAKAKKDSKKKGGSGMRAVADRIIDLTTSDQGDAIFGIYASDCESVEMNQPPMVGHDAIRKKLEGWGNMVSDPKFTAKNVWIDGNTIIIEWVGDVTMKASGKQATLREIAIHEIKDGKIKRERYYYDPQALQAT